MAGSLQASGSSSARPTGIAYFKSQPGCTSLPHSQPRSCKAIGPNAKLLDDHDHTNRRMPAAPAILQGFFGTQPKAEALQVGIKHPELGMWTTSTVCGRLECSQQPTERERQSQLSLSCNVQETLQELHIVWRDELGGRMSPLGGRNLGCLFTEGCRRRLVTTSVNESSALGCF